MQYALLLCTALLLTLQKVTQKRYNTICKSGALLFSGMISLCAMLVFAAVVTVDRAWNWTPHLILPAVGFGLSYAAATVFTVLAIRNGSLARTTLVTSYSLLIPALAGLLVLREPLKGTMLAGILILVLALWLTNHRRSDGKVTLKWVVFVTLSFAGNGLCSTVQKLAPHYIAEAKLYQNMYMIAALGLSSAVLITASFLMKETDRKTTLHRGAPLALICGLCNGGVNILVLYLNARIPASVMFPVISAGQIILVCLYSLPFCREHFTKKQWAGFAVGILSAVLLNL